MEKILVTVGGLNITEADVNDFLANLGQRGQGYNTPEGKKMVLEQLVADKLLLLYAKRNLIESEPEFKAELAKLKDSLLVNYVGSKLLSDVKVSDKEIEEYYNANPNKFKTGETVNASHILVESEEQAKSIYEEIASGKTTFEDAAKEYSSCPSKENGGNLGEFGRGQMVPEFDKAVFEMNEGEITSEPVKTQFGYHLIKLVSKSEASVLPLADILPQLRESLLNEKRRNAYQSKINQLKIMFPVDMH